MRPDPSLLKGLVSFAVAAALVLTAGACATSPAEKSAAGETAGATAGSEGGEAEEGKRKKPWWRLSQYRRDTGLEPIEPHGMRPGRGLFSGEDGYIVLYRKGGGGSSGAASSDPTKPTKVRR